MLCLRLALISAVAMLALADVDVTTPLSPSTPPISDDLIPEYEDLSEKQQLPASSAPQLTILNVGDTLWKCGCDFKEFLDDVRTKSSQDATTFLEIRCQGPEGILEVWSDAVALKYCPDQEYEDSSSQEYDDEYEDIEAAEETDVADENAVLIDDLEKEDTVLRQEITELVDDVAVTEDVDVIQDVDDYREEEIIVFDRDHVFSASETNVVLYGVPAFVLVLILAALTVFAIGVSVTVCRALARRGPGRQGWATLHEEGGNDAAYVKVPLE